MKDYILVGIGVALGAIPTYFIVKSKYERIAQEEIDSVKEHFCIRKDIPTDKTDDEDEKESHPSKKLVHIEVIDESEPNSRDLVYNKAVYDSLINSYSSTEVAKEPTPSEGPSDRPVVVTPDEFEWNIHQYDVYLTEYSVPDQMLINEVNDEILIIADTIGYEALEHFGEYEQDVVYVRNDKLGAYYFVTRTELSYGELVGDMEEADD